MRSLLYDNSELRSIFTTMTHRCSVSQLGSNWFGVLSPTSKRLLVVLMLRLSFGYDLWFTVHILHQTPVVSILREKARVIIPIYPGAVKHALLNYVATS